MVYFFFFFFFLFSLLVCSSVFVFVKLFPFQRTMPVSCSTVNMCVAAYVIHTDIGRVCVYLKNIGISVEVRCQIFSAHEMLNGFSILCSLFLQHELKLQLIRFKCHRNFVYRSINNISHCKVAGKRPE